MLFFIKFLAAFSLALVALVNLNVHAQIHQGLYDIIQNGKKVGEIYTPVRKETDTSYSEYWILYPTYVYPNSKATVILEFKPNVKRVKDEQEFQRSSRPDGSKYIIVNATEFSNLPVQ
jgi:hypothetical protein